MVDIEHAMSEIITLREEVLQNKAMRATTRIACSVIMRYRTKFRTHT